MPICANSGLDYLRKDRMRRNQRTAKSQVSVLLIWNVIPQTLHRTPRLQRRLHPADPEGRSFYAVAEMNTCKNRDDPSTIHKPNFPNVFVSNPQ